MHRSNLIAEPELLTSSWDLNSRPEGKVLTLGDDGADTGAEGDCQLRARPSGWNRGAAVRHGGRGGGNSGPGSFCPPG